MAQQIINVGTTANDGTGDTLRSAFQKVNDNFTENYSELNAATNLNTASTIVKRDASGNFSAGTITAALAGNASTATTLETARTINGTSFNGSANITTANWGTARTLTIGSTGKSVNGSANVSWTLTEIGAQPADADLTAIAALVGTSGLLRKTAADTWSLDTNAYITGNQTITFTGDATGSGTTSVTLTLANSGVTANTYNNSSTAITPFTVDAKGRITATGAAVTITPAWGSITGKPTTLAGYGITDAQPLDSDLTAVAGLSTTGFISRTGTGTATTRSIAVSGTGLSVSNADGISGNPTITSNATSANTASTIVARDASGNFSAGTITASLSGNASTATTLQTARNISLTGDVTGSASFNGSADISITATVGDNSHNHTTLTGVTSIAFAADGTDSASITTTVSSPNTYFDFNLTDDVTQSDTWRWRFTPSGGTVFSAMELDASAQGIANLTLPGNASVNSITIDSQVLKDYATVTTSSTTQTQLFSFAAATYGSGEIIIQATQGSLRQITKLLVVHNGTTADATEFGVVMTGTKLFDVDVDINTGNVRILVTSTSATSTVYKTTYTLIGV